MSWSPSCRIQARWAVDSYLHDRCVLARFPEVATVGQAGRPGIVHRLDVGTSGLLVVARTPPAYESLVAQLAARTVERRYLTRRREEQR